MLEHRRRVLTDSIEQRSVAGWEREWPMVEEVKKKSN